MRSAQPGMGGDLSEVAACANPELAGCCLMTHSLRVIGQLGTFRLAVTAASLRHVREVNGTSRHIVVEDVADLREVTRRVLAALRPDLQQGWFLPRRCPALSSTWCGNAARRRIRRTRDISPQDDAPAPSRPSGSGTGNRRQQRLGVWVGRVFVDRGLVTDLDDLAGYMTPTRSEMWRTTDRSWAMKMYVRSNSSCSCSNRLITCACTDTSSADTGSSHDDLGAQCQAAGDPDALALAAGELVGIAIDVLSGFNPTTSSRS